jgi:hypothetical protein
MTTISQWTANQLRRWGDSPFDNLNQRRRRAIARAERLTELRKGVCAHCGSPIPDCERSSRRFCSPSCRSAARRLRELERAKVMLGADPQCAASADHQRR